MKPIQALAIAAVAAWTGSAAAADMRPSGFYGGISVREHGTEQRMSIGEAGNAARFASAVALPAHSQSFVFGGYRWRNDLSLEAAIRSVEDYRLGGRGGVGLVMPDDASAPRTLDVDVYGSWSFWRSLSLYGRLGYSQSEALPVYSTSIAAADPRARNGLNYGVGLRYDLTRSLGLKLEYARPAALAGEPAQGLPEGDQVQFGLQFRF